MTNDSTPGKKTEKQEIEGNEELKLDDAQQREMRNIPRFPIAPVYLASSPKEVRFLEAKMKQFMRHVRVSRWFDDDSPRESPLEMYAASGFDGSVIVSPQQREVSTVYLYTGSLQAQRQEVEVMYSREGSIVKIDGTAFYLSPFRFRQREEEQREGPTEEQDHQTIASCAWGLNPAAYAPVKVVPAAIGSPQHCRDALEAWQGIEQYVAFGRKRNPHGGIDSVMSGIIEYDSKGSVFPGGVSHYVSLWPREQVIDMMYIIPQKSNEGKAYQPLRIGITRSGVEIVHRENHRRYNVHFNPTYFGEQVQWQSL